MAVVLEKKYLVDEQDKNVGVTLPIRRGTAGYFESSFTTKEQIKSNIKSLLLTQKGERVMQPEFGTRLRGLLFEQITTDLGSALETEITTAIERWMPYVNVESIIYDATEDQNRIDLELNYSLKYSNSQILEQLNIVI